MNIEYDIKEILTDIKQSISKLDTKLDKVTENVGELKTNLVRVELELFHAPARNPKIINIKPGTLDDTGWLEPVGNLWTQSAQKWVVINEQMLNYEGQPSDFSVLFERFHNQQAKNVI